MPSQGIAGEAPQASYALSLKAYQASGALSRHIRERQALSRPKMFRDIVSDRKSEEVEGRKFINACKLKLQDKNVAKCIAGSRASNTWKAYTNWVCRWRRFARQKAISDAMDVSENSVAAFLSTLRSAKSISQAAAALSLFFSLKNVSPNPIQSQLITLIKSSAKRNAPSIRHAKYVSANVVKTLLQYLLKKDELVSLRLASAVAICYSGLLRIGECLNLHLNDFTIAKDRVLLHIREGKTDRSRLGQRATLHCTNSQLSPFTILTRYLSKGGLKLGKKGAVFREMRRNTGDSSLGTHKASYNTLRKNLTEACKAAGLSQRISWHSFRAGGASRAINKGAPLELVKDHGRWRSEEGIAPYIKRDKKALSVVPKFLTL